jgi:hypothetical protein
LVLFQCMWQSSQDAGLSTSPDSWLHLNKRLFAAAHESASGTKRTCPLTCRSRRRPSSNW